MEEKQKTIATIVDQLKKQNVPEVPKGSSIRLNCPAHGDNVDGTVVDIANGYAAAFCGECIDQRGPLFLILAANVAPTAYLKIVQQKPEDVNNGEAKKEI